MLPSFTTSESARRETCKRRVTGNDAGNRRWSERRQHDSSNFFFSMLSRRIFLNALKAAHVGVGISGEEGLQAVNASDYSIAQVSDNYVRKDVL